MLSSLDCLKILTRDAIAVESTPIRLLQSKAIREGFLLSMTLKTDSISLILPMFQSPLAWMIIVSSFSVKVMVSMDLNIAAYKKLSNILFRIMCGHVTVSEHFNCL